MTCVKKPRKQLPISKSKEDGDVQNYHCHKSFSNINTPFKDSAASYEDYAKRAVELGHEILSSVEHGWQGNYFKCAQVAQKYGLKFVYGTEAYWVHDRAQPDRTNAHIIILAQNIKGVYEINEMLSAANETGYYGAPRVDVELLTKLSPENVFITTACVAFWAKVDKATGELKWHYGEDDNSQQYMLEMVEVLHERFGSSFALEVQCHNTSWQKEINRLCVSLHYKYGIPLIAGLDSHYIYPEQKQERQYLREESGVKMDDGDYEFDSEVYEDYPDEDTVRERFRKQGVLTEQEIDDAISMTDTIIFFDDIVFDKSRKLPSYDKSLTQEQRNELYLKRVYEAWDEYKKNVPPERWKEYENSFYENEVKIVLDSGMADYFLIDSEMVKIGKEMGGRITPTGRGSSGSWFTNTLLGMSTLDRFSLPVPLYPARFCTAERLVSSVPDLDLNLSDPAIFAAAQEKVLGKGHSYPMIAYGTLKYKSAFKLLARVKGIPADIANTVSKQITAYELALKEAETDDEREAILIEDYVSSEYAPYIAESEPYRGIVVSKSQAPCAYMIYDGDIRSEVGIMRINADGGKKVVYCTVCDGYTAEDFGYVKNDLLAVKTITQSGDAMARAELPQYTSREIIELTKNDAATWDILAKGYTQGINQCQGASTTEKLRMYKPRSLQDLSAFVAAIRPGFKSMAPKFLRREKFSYGIPSFDELLKNDTSGSSWLLYQEDIMKCLGLAGFPMDETYPIIKAISKKKAKVIEAAKERFLEGFSEHIVENEGKSEEDAVSISEGIWQIIIDSASYSFNASHSVAVALDALYGAYLKAHYPYEYYATLLESYSDDANKEKVALIKEEMRRAFGISVVPAKLGQDNRKFFIDKENKSISDALPSVKYVSKACAEALYNMSDMKFDNFVDLLVYLDGVPEVKKNVIHILIMMDYFVQYGSNSKLLKVFEAFTEGNIRYDKKYVDATKAKRLAALYELEKSLPEETIPLTERICFEGEYFGLPMTTDSVNGKAKYLVLSAETSYTPKIKLYSIANGKIGTVKVRKPVYNASPIRKGDCITVLQHMKRPAYSYDGGERHVIPGVSEFWMTDYRLDYRKEAVN